MSRFEEIGKQVGQLVAEKQKAYGDSFGRSGAVLRQLYPDGISPDQYDNLLTVARVLDKLFRIATNPSAFGENPYKDIVGYGILGMKRFEDGEKIDNAKWDGVKQANIKAAVVFEEEEVGTRADNEVPCPYCFRNNCICYHPLNIKE